MEWNFSLRCSAMSTEFIIMWVIPSLSLALPVFSIIFSTFFSMEKSSKTLPSPTWCCLHCGKTHEFVVYQNSIFYFRYEKDKLCWITANTQTHSRVRAEEKLFGWKFSIICCRLAVGYVVYMRHTAAFSGRQLDTRCSRSSKTTAPLRWAIVWANNVRHSRD